MKKEGLSAKQVEHMKPDPERRLEVAAGPPTGLYLIVQPTGAKSWAFRYRWLGNTRKLTFTTPYPDLGLAAARAEAQSKLAELDNGIDPARTQAQEVEAAELPQESASSVIDEYLKRKIHVGADKRWKQEIERILKREAVEKWKHRMIADISKPDVLRLLDGIVDRGASVMACRTRGALMPFFDWAKERGYIEQSPMTDVGKPGPDNQNRDRVLDPTEIVAVWSAAEPLGYPIGPFVRFLMLSAQRRGEVATMRWKDIDLDRAVWTIPAESTKPGRIHDVPLSGPAAELLQALPRFTKGHYVFTTTSGANPINGFSKFKRHLDAETLKQRTDAGLKENIAEWTMHDLRRTAATRMAEQGVPPHILSAILNHSAGSTQGVTAIYNRFRYEKERRAALEAWAAYVVTLTKPATKAAIA